MELEQWLYYPSCDTDLTDVFNSHKSATVETDSDGNLVVTSTTTYPVTTPGALTYSLYVKAHVPYVIEVSAKKTSSESQPYIYVGDGINVGVEPENRVFFTSEYWETKSYRFYFDKDTEVRVGVLLSQANVGDGYKLKSLFMRNYWDPIVGSNTKEGRDVLEIENFDDVRRNTVFGQNSLESIEEGINNTAMGYDALERLKSGDNNTAIGCRVLHYSSDNSNDTGVGSYALSSSEYRGSENTAVGAYSLHNNTSGSENVALGYYSMNNNSSGESNTALGTYANSSNTSGDDNVAVGYYALSNNTTGDSNVAVGIYSLNNLVSGNYNVGIGRNAGNSITNTSENTFIGYNAGAGSGNYSHVTCVGSGADVNGNNQVQLGSASDTVYVVGVLTSRSDLRDKAEIRDTQLGLNFINQLHPVDFKWDNREFYKTPMPEMPLTSSDTASMEKYNVDYLKWSEDNRMANLHSDGTKKRNRFHHGFIAQEVGSLGIFGGYQDFLVNGGDDVKALGYSEFIAPLVKAVQELSAENNSLKHDNDTLKERLENLETNMQVVLSRLT
jgi:hypothetical protein